MSNYDFIALLHRVLMKGKPVSLLAAVKTIANELHVLVDEYGKPVDAHGSASEDDSKSESDLKNA